MTLHTIRGDFDGVSPSGKQGGPLGAGSPRNNKEPLAGSHSDSL
ncbi:hypothetical protein ymoll0001_21320 [Yersinia mollaretii ATCC 43969]|uniref:Uncharacterized protein n=1 Tax=Yersinia mollaretii (strain ATCC 43969 / DSM 18520 / CIP 103324 / CNY 7263 / WAIP 204) TaxID=349967 RepID=A0ABP2EJK8_YERMW|nr:hypothetical protein ymoll0001_21320 [Yersinia mollaretii ATCC 43969]